jgi:hypothetical protein
MARVVVAATDLQTYRAHCDACPWRYDGGEAHQQAREHVRGNPDHWAIVTAVVTTAYRGRP